MSVKIGKDPDEIIDRTEETVLKDIREKANEIREKKRELQDLQQELRDLRGIDESRSWKDRALNALKNPISYLTYRFLKVVEYVKN